MPASPPAARRAAVLGAPIAHSLSPVLHNAAYAALGLDGWKYEAIECDAPGLPALLDSLDGDWAGLSLTMPLKRAVLPLLDGAEPLVTQVGGANTVILGAAGRQGFNTDVPGMIATLAGAGVTQVPDALVLGAGATACAALAALHGIGTRQAAVAVRDPATAGPLLAVAERLGLAARLVEFGADPGEPGRQLLISTVPSGAADIYAERIVSGTLAPRAVVDVVYYPWPTRLAAAAEQAGVAVAGGFELLLHQATGQVRLMTGRDAPAAAMRAAGRAALARR
ncbi:MAG TPA: shikimate dehydrogenase [Streptosporangiaceae bacterium]